MPITIAPNKFHVKKTDGSGYLPCNVVTGETTEEQCTRVTNQGTSEVNRVVAKGNEVLADLSGSTEMEGMIAGTFAAANTYSAGTYVIYPTTVGSSTVNKLYRLTADHAANVTWENTSKVEVKLGNDVSDLKSALNGITSIRGIFETYGTPALIYGVHPWLITIDFIRIADIDSFSIKAYSNVGSICYYDKNLVFISSQVGTSASTPTTITSFTEPTGAVYVRFCYNQPDGITINLKSGVTLYSALKYLAFNEIRGNGIKDYVTLNGYYNSNNGVFSPTASWTAVIDFLPISDIVDFSVKLRDGAAGICYFNERFEYIGCETTTASAGQVVTSFTAPTGAVYVRFCRQNTDAFSLSLRDGYTSVKVMKINDFYNTIKDTDRFKAYTFVDGYYDSETGNYSYTSSWKAVADFIPINEVAEFRVLLRAGAGGICYYDKDFKYLTCDEGTGTGTTAKTTFTDVTNAVYVRFCKFITDPLSIVLNDGYLSISTLTKEIFANDLKYNKRLSDLENTVEEPVYHTLARKPFEFSGKTSYWVGDSICYGVVHYAEPDVHGTGDFPTLFCGKTNMICNNIAVSAACFCSGYNQATTIPTQVQSIPTSAIDILFIEGGVNDWQVGATLSEFTTAISNLCDYINTNFDNDLPVVWITPINEGGWTAGATRKATLQAFRNAMTQTVMMKDTYARFSVLQGVEFNFPDKYDNETYIDTMFGDKLHPSALGYKTLYVAGLLNALCK